MQQADVSKSRRTILVLDHEPIVVDFLRLALGSAGYQVITADDYDAALSLFSLHAGDLALIIAEIALPTKSGPEFIDSLPSLDPHIPVIFMTCLGDEEVRPKSLDCCARLLHKPFRNAELKAAIEAIGVS